MYRGRDVYQGPFKDQAPDLILFVDDYRCDLANGLGRGRLWEPAGRLTGVHHPDGVVILHGPGVRSDRRLQAEIVDIAPTILHALDAPIPEDCDGRPLEEAFAAQSDFRRRPPRRERLSKGEGAEHVWTDEEEAQVMKRLQDLGYM